jgi:hypothetical protein
MSSAATEGLATKALSAVSTAVRAACSPPALPPTPSLTTKQPNQSSRW